MGKAHGRGSAAYLLLTYFSRRVRARAYDGPVDRRAGPNAMGKAHGRGSAAYLLLTYFSRRICGIARPAPFSASKHASTMFGLPHR